MEMAVALTTEISDQLGTSVFNYLHPLKTDCEFQAAAWQDARCLDD
ncbi:hypothetical protein [Caballeronia sp. KNU42]